MVVIRIAGSSSIGSVAWYSGNSWSNSHPAGQKQANELGIYDMTGNVLEWCWDWCDNYPSGSVTDPTGPSSGSYRVYRGGCWMAYAPYCRVADRYYGNPVASGYNLGFRVVLPPGQ